MKGKLILLNCPVCNCEFTKDISNYKRNIKRKGNTFCSRKCSGKYYGLIKANKGLIKQKNYDYLKVCREDEFSGFRYYMTLLKRRKNKNLNTDITINFLKNLWEEQKGICPYTNIPLNLMKHNTKHHIYPFYSWASLDRIDSKIGYTQNNVEFVSLAINYMKNKYSKKQTIDFLNIIKST
jgi:hypothetical protein